jgi:hypothetical protein
LLTIPYRHYEPTPSARQSGEEASRLDGREGFRLLAMTSMVLATSSERQLVARPQFSSSPIHLLKILLRKSGLKNRFKKLRVKGEIDAREYFWY